MCVWYAFWLYLQHLRKTRFVIKPEDYLQAYYEYVSCDNIKRDCSVCRDFPPTMRMHDRFYFRIESTSENSASPNPTNHDLRS